jgi:hypothetical protein
MTTLEGDQRSGIPVTTRRRLMASAASTLAAARLGRRLGGAEVERERDQEPEAFILKSQPLPEPRISLPTDALPPPDRVGRPRRIAAVVTSYFRYSHADDIVTKFMEGYSVVGRTHKPHCRVVSLSIEQTGTTDIGRPLAARYGIPVFDSATQALTLGGDQLAVDGVLLVAEHGEYPFNNKGQQLYPRRRLFEEILATFRRSGRSVPVYCDKHLSYDWLSARWMVEQARTAGFPLMAGSSVPVAWRRPPLAFRSGVALENALAVGFSGVEVYGFHTLELLQTFVEKRRGGETGVSAVRCLEGPTAWDVAEHGAWRSDLLIAALATVPGGTAKAGSLRDSGLAGLRNADPNPVVFLIEYCDGFRGAAYLSRGLIDEFAFAADVRGRPEPVATWCELNKPQRDHFSFLCNHIEVMFRTGRPSYPVERTLLVTGTLAAAMDSRAQGGARIATPHLADVAYTPAADFTGRSDG